MPVYDWECSECKHHIEELLPLSESDKYNNIKCADRDWETLFHFS